MNNNQCTQRAVRRADIDPAESWAEVTRTEPSRRAARGILILALVVSGLGTEAAATPGHHASVHHAAHKASDTSLEGGAYLTSFGHAIRDPWQL